MSIFGQVWLWSAAAFILGVLLTWVFLVRPAQARSRVLERRLLAAQTKPKAADASAQERRAVPPIRTFDREPVQETPEPAPVAPAAAESAAEAGHATSAPEPAWHERDSFDQEPSGPASSVLEPELASERTSIFRPQETSMFSPAESPAQQEPHESYARQEPYAAESYAPQESPAQRASYSTELFAPQESPAQREPFTLEEQREPERGSLFDPSYEPPTATPPAYAFSEDQPPAPDEHPAETTHVLPQRQPRNSPRGGFDAPQPIQPSMRPVERREPVLSDDNGRSGSLFEPVVRPNSGGAHSAPEPPPARSQSAGSSVPLGPFGPGSAMPMPGGASPSGDFTVKASVTALRYCTEESPQFPRMVAEVWFRSAADAERVGFRPLT